MDSRARQPNLRADGGPLLAALRGQGSLPAPIWLMRQAGRYLPEYRALRKEAGSFLDLCLNPALAAEATLQPIRRFHLDAAIIFSDILLIPRALGQAVTVDDATGPRLQPFGEAFPTMTPPAEMDGDSLDPVYRALKLVKAKLPDGVGLIGFAGAPWTLACYMIEGGGSKDYAKARAFAYGNPDAFERLIGRLTTAVADHSIAQVAAGANVVQIFDSWAGVLPAPALRRWSVEPIRAIARRVKAAAGGVPVIVFPRGAGVLYRDYLDTADALSLDTAIPVDWAAAELQGKVAVQGNLDPAALVAGGETMRAEARRILGALGRGRFVFNLGHGVLPETPPEHVAELVELVRAWRP